MSTPPDNVPVSPENVPVYQSENLEGLAQGILEGATDVPTGKTALVDAYNKYNWDDPKKALGIVEYYGEAVRNKLQDQTPLPNVDAALPVSLMDVLPDLPKDANDKDLYNKWEEVNTQALENNDNPVYAVNKPQLLKQLKQAASAGRRQANMDARPNMDTTGGQDFAELSDIGNRFTGSLLQGTGVGAVADAVGGSTGYNLNNWVTEYTDPTRDNRFFSKATQTVGNAAGGFLSYSVGGAPLGLTSGIAQSSDIVANTAYDTFENTGDPTKAFKAGGIEAAAQVPQLFGERLVLGGAAEGKVADTLFGSVKNIAKAATIQAGVGAVSQTLTNQASNIKEKGQPNADTRAFRGVAEASGLQALAGGFIQGGVEVSPPVQILGAGNDPGIRQREIDANGQPTTSTVKQVVGDLFSNEIPVKTTEDPKVSETPKDITPDEIHEAVVDTQDSTTIPEEDSGIPSTPSFATDRGVVYHDDGTGHIEGDKAILPSDKQIFLSQTDNEKVQKALGDGSHFYLDDKGNPVLEEKVLKDGDVNTVITPVEHLTSPGKDLYAWNVNAEKSPTKGTRLRQVSPAGKVVSVNDIPLKDVGAAQRPYDALTQFSQKVLQSDIVPDENKAPVGYYITPNELTRSEASNLVQREGFDKVYNKVLNNDLSSFGGPLEQQGVIGHILDNFKAGIVKATQEGNTQELDKLNSEFGKFLSLPHVQGTELGQGLQFRTTFPLEPLKRISEAYQKGVEAHVAENLPEIKRTQEELVQRAKDLETTKKSATPSITPEEIAVENEVKAQAIDSHKNDVEYLNNKIKDLEKRLETSKTPEKIQTKINDLNTKKERVLTPEERALKNPTYRKIQERREKTLTENQSKLKAAEKAYQDTLSKKTSQGEAAKKRGLEAVKEQTALESEVEKLENFKKTSNLSKGETAVVDDKIALLRSTGAVGEARTAWYNYWIQNQVANGTNIIAATLTSGVLGLPLSTVALVPTSVRALFNNLTHGTLSEYHYPVLSFLKGALASPTTWRQTIESARTAITEGRRYEGVATREELLGPPRFKVNKPKTTDTSIEVGAEGQRIEEHLGIQNHNFQDYVNRKTDGEKFFSWAAKNPLKAVPVIVRGTLVEPFIRGLMTVEAVTRSLHAGGMDEAARDIYFNRETRAGNLQAREQYLYDRDALWKKAQATAAINADGLRSLGIETSRGQQHINALESYYSQLPRQVAVDVQKKASQMVYNGPAAGIVGHVARFVQMGADAVNIPTGFGGTFNPAKYLIAFSNAGAHATNLMLEQSPLSIASAYFPSGPKSPVERTMLLGSGLVSLGLLSGLAVKSLANLETPEKDRWFDIIGRYSSDPKKVSAFTSQGGQLYSFRFGNKYIPFKDTQLSMGMGAIASIVDMKRDGKLTDENLHTQAGITTALAMASLSMLTAPTQLSFMKTLGNLYDGISKAATASGKGDDTTVNAVVGQIGRQILMTTKGFIPGAGVLRTISHYTDNPVEAQKDIQSAIVANIPYLQAHGIPGVIKPLPALNVFGEKLDTHDHTGIPAVHRVFSTRADDADIRWLTDNGYSVPDPYQVITKKNHTIKSMGITDGLTSRQEHALAMTAAPSNRQTVAQFRESFGSSAFNDKVQKRLSKAIRMNYATAAARLGLPALESSEADGEAE